MIMHQVAAEVCQDADLIHGNLATFGMGSYIGPLVIGGIMQPQAFAIDIYTGFIGMQ